MLTFDKDTHSYYWNEKRLPSVTAIISILSNFDSIDRDVLSRAAEFGKAVHRSIELLEKHELDIFDLDSNLLPYIKAYKDFMNDYKPVIIASELQVYSEKYQYAGTIDMIIKYKNKLGVIDFKTGSQYYPQTAVQLFGYQIAYEEMRENRISFRWCVNINKDKYKVTDCKDLSDKVMFLTCLTEYQCQEKIRNWKSKNNIKEISNV